MSLPGGQDEITYVPGHRQPWIPFAPLHEDVLIRYFRIDPVRGEVAASVRIAPGLRLAPSYHTGPVVAHTVRGAWRHLEHAWIARRGDTVFGAAGSMHTVESVGEEDAIVFLEVAGEILFFDEGGGLAWQETWRTAAERYSEFCAAHPAGGRDPVGPMVGPGGQRGEEAP